MKRTVIKEISPTICRYKRGDYEREFRAPAEGGYVFDENGQQPFHNLSTRGPTIIFPGTRVCTLAETIRSHHRGWLRQRREWYK